MTSTTSTTTADALEARLVGTGFSAVVYEVEGKRVALIDQPKFIAEEGIERRQLVRGVERLVVRRPSLGAIRDAVHEETARIVALTRLSPVFSFSILSVFYGALRVPFLAYLRASVLGRSPGP